MTFMSYALTMLSGLFAGFFISLAVLTLIVSRGSGKSWSEPPVRIGDVLFSVFPAEYKEDGKLIQPVGEYEILAWSVCGVALQEDGWFVCGPGFKYIPYRKENAFTSREEAEKFIEKSGGTVR